MMVYFWRAVSGSRGSVAAGGGGLSRPVWFWVVEDASLLSSQPIVNLCSLPVIPLLSHFHHRFFFFNAKVLHQSYMASNFSTALKIQSSHTIFFSPTPSSQRGLNTACLFSLWRHIFTLFWDHALHWNFIDFFFNFRMCKVFLWRRVSYTYRLLIWLILEAVGSHELPEWCGIPELQVIGFAEMSSFSKQICGSLIKLRNIENFIL